MTSNTIFVAQNSRTKRQELDEQAVQTFYLTNAWQQNDLNDVQTALRNVMPNAKVYGVQSQNAIVMRGTPDELLLAQQLIDDLDKPRGEVVVDIAVLEVSKNWERTLGMAWPSSFGVALQPNCAQTNSCASTTAPQRIRTGGTSTTISPTLYNLAHLNSTNFAVTVGSATLNLLLTDNNTKVLQSPRIRATDGQKATMKIGSRIPIATGSYQTGSGDGAGQLAGEHAVPVPGCGREYRDDAQHSLRPRRHAEDEDRSFFGERNRDHQRSDGADHQPARGGPDDPAARGRGEHSGRHPEQPGAEELERHSRAERDSDSEIRLRVEGSHIQNDDIVFVVVPHIVRSQELDQANLRVIDTGEGQSIDLRRADDAAMRGCRGRPCSQPH